MDLAQLIAQAHSKGITIATAESCTGGLIAAALTETPGSSIVFDRGFVTYSNAAKQDMLGVQNTTLTQYGAVSEAVAREMAEGALNASSATLAVSVTGIAGPGGSEFKPEGRVCFGLAQDGHKTFVETQDFGPLGRSNVRNAAQAHGLDLLWQAIDPKQ
nr:CinA family protein [Epibacterium ulvae]